MIGHDENGLAAPVLGAESASGECNDSASIQLEIAHSSRGLAVLSVPGMLGAARMAGAAFTEAALWTPSAERRAVWLRCSEQIDALGWLSSGLVIQAGAALSAALSAAREVAK
ncbi:MAG: hypothetical protein FJ191_14055 [Gammaproteobacteria bacterium]|nr:hypothetical protein [Gammaproteobacteria bacterium]